MKKTLILLVLGLGFVQNSIGDEKSPCEKLSSEIYQLSMEAGFTHQNAQKQAALAKTDCKTFGLDKI